MPSENDAGGRVPEPGVNRPGVNAPDPHAAEARLTEREKLLALHNYWLRRARDVQDPMERVVLNGCAEDLRKALYG